MYKSLSIYATLLTLLLLISGCGSDSTGPDKTEDGTVMVQVFTTGQNTDSTHYSVKADGKSQGTTETKPAKIADREGSMEVMEFHHDIAKSPRTNIELTGVPERCSVKGGPTQTATVKSGATTKVIFSVSCEDPFAEKSYRVYGDCFYFHGEWVMWTHGLLFGCPRFQELDPSVFVPLDPNNPGLSQPSVSFDGSKLAFGSGGNLYVRSTQEGSDAQQLTDTGKDHSPSYCPDGSLFFTSTREGRSQLYWLPEDGKQPKAITTRQQVYEVECNPVKNSKFEAAVRVGSGAEASIGLVDVDTTKAQRVHILTNNDYFEGEPTWTPDGKSLVILSEQNKGIYNLTTISAKDGSIEEQTDFKPGYLDTYANPSVSPDGKWMVFTSIAQPNGKSDGARMQASDYNATRSNRTHNGIVNPTPIGDGGFSYPPLITFGHKMK